MSKIKPAIYYVATLALLITPLVTKAKNLIYNPTFESDYAKYWIVTGQYDHAWEGIWSDVRKKWESFSSDFLLEHIGDFNVYKHYMSIGKKAQGVQLMTSTFLPETHFKKVELESEIKMTNETGEGYENDSLVITVTNLKGNVTYFRDEVKYDTTIDGFNGDVDTFKGFVKYNWTLPSKILNHRGLPVVVSFDMINDESGLTKAYIDKVSLSVIK